MAGKTPLYFGESGNTKLGKFWLAVSDQGLVAVEWGLSQAEFEAKLAKRFKRATNHEQKRIKGAAKELDEYLKGRRRFFSQPIDWMVLRPFQRLALQATHAIPYGETRTYKEIAEQIQHPGAARAVGRAEATNPMPVVIPCHRVIGSDGKLTGYGMGHGLRTKEWLLKLEGAMIV